MKRNLHVLLLLLTLSMIIGCAAGKPYIPYSGEEKVVTYVPYTWSGETTSYIPRKGDTLNMVAAKYGIGTAIIVKMNPDKLDGYNQPIPGERLLIPDM